MAHHNHPPPFFAPPYVFAPQQPQQHPPAIVAQSPDYHAHAHAHAQHGFQSIPGLPPPPHPPALPGLNFTSYAHNNQQAPVPPAAWSQLPLDPHLSMSMFHQHSAFPPPPLPGLGMPPASIPQTPQNHHPSSRGLPAHPPPPHALPPPSAPMGERIQEVRDSDKEEGELSEGDCTPRPPPARARGKAPLHPRSSLPPAASAAPRGEEAYNPDCPAAGQIASYSSVPKPSQRDSTLTLADKIQRDRDEAKLFIKTLSSNGIGYRTLAKEELDLDLLRGLYQSLNLPSEPAPILPPKSNGSEPKTSTAQPATNPTIVPPDSNKSKPPTPMVKTNHVTSVSAKPTVSPITQVDRKDYVARLQAARKAKQAAEAKPHPPQPTSKAKTPTKPATSAPAHQEMHETPTPMVDTTMTDEQRRLRTTELVKQRLKELKGQPKASTPSKSSTVIEKSSAKPVKQSPATSRQAALPALAGSHTHGNPTSIPMFPGIPGLFMKPPSQSAGDIATPRGPSPAIPQKRPAPSDSTGFSTPRGSVTPYSRPLGQSPHANGGEEESMIIQVSDDDSNGSDMDLDDQQGPKVATAPQLSVPNTSQVAGNLSNIQSRSGSTKPSSSVVSTPGPQTPSTQAREKELEDKEKQLAAMRLTLKKKLAEKREKDRAAAAAAAATVATSSPLRQHSSATDTLSTVVSEPQPASFTTDLGKSPPVSGTSTGTDAIPDSNRDHKRLRRAEIQSRLPTLDAEIASNASRMARLTEEMNKLLAENEKITKDKEQLTSELESLGIDTEGMSHAQLRAKKDEIEREKSPEKEAPASDTHTISEPTASKQSHSPLMAVETTRTAGLPTRTIPVASSRTITQVGALPGLASAMPPAPRRVPDDTAQNGSPAMEAKTDADVAQTSSMSRRAGTNNPGSMKPFKATDFGSVTPPDDEDFYSPLPPDASVRNLEAPPGAAPPVVPEPAVDALISPSEGEVEMSESSDEDEEEEEYDPEDVGVNAEARLQATQVPDTASERSRAISSASIREEEDYEPPDADHEASREQTQITAADSSETTHHNAADDGAMDIATSSSEESSHPESTSGDETTPEVDPGASSSTNNVLLRPTDAADGPVPESEAHAATAPTAQNAANFANIEEERIKFTPYESPLRMFKSYRYHPTYANDVSGGFLSWTFSHQLDPEKCLCQYDSAGNKCNDPACPDQHFEDIGITGEKLLVQLGTANPGENAEERQKWNDGLRSVLKELRVKNIKDPNGIAVEIAKYRRQFLNDETRVVNLPHNGS